jgi:hypothetical protein
MLTMVPTVVLDRRGTRAHSRMLSRASRSAFARACLFKEEAQPLATGIGPLRIGVGTRRLSARPLVARAVHQPVFGDRRPGIGSVDRERISGESRRPMSGLSYRCGQ